jgi:prevent-host-death family protein
MKTLDFHEAKTQFSRLVDAAAAGEEIIIAKAGVPAARLGPVTPTKPVRKFGLLKGKISIADDFDAPLPPELMADFEGR